MPELIKPLTLAIALALAAGPVLAQEATEEAEAAETEDPADPLALNLGDDGPALGDIYTAESFTDWDMRCVKTDREEDPCQLYQLLDDGAGNSVAEINIFPVSEGGEAVAGATVVTPLETLLTQQLTLTVDGGSQRRYPFSWCSEVGCFARLGFTQPEVDLFRRGSKATVTIVPVTAPDQKVNLDMSLSGFTAAFNALKARIEDGG